MDYDRTRKIYGFLVQKAREQQTTTYKPLGEHVDLHVNNTKQHNELNLQMEEINTKLAKVLKEPVMLTVLVLKAHSDLPSTGFFTCAGKLGYTVNNIKVSQFITEEYKKQFCDEQKKAVYAVKQWPNEDDLWP